MNSLRKWFNRPKKSDSSLLAQFFFADEELNEVAAELDSFDGRKDPERCTTLVNKLRTCQDKVLVVVQKIIDEAIGNQKANRDFRVKFPDDVLQENLAGQLWFGAECLAAGSSIMNREIESASMRPLARALTKNLDSLRTLLREQCLRNQSIDSDRVRESLTIFDKLFAEFELSYVIPLNNIYDMFFFYLRDTPLIISVLFCRALKKGLIEQEMIDDYDPALMFTIPRLAIVCGLLVYPEGPLNPNLEPSNISEMFRPFQTLLQKIRELLHTLNEKELSALEGALCSAEEPEKILTKPEQKDESSQVDPGFEEETESSTSTTLTEITRRLEQEMAQISDTSIDLLTPEQEASNGSNLPFDDYSPTNTLVDSLEGQESLNSSLNKSESRDSGLQSENVSTSETVMCDASTVSMSSDSTVVCTETLSADSNLADHDVQFFCRDIVNELVNQATGGLPPYSRQSSQQYNLNLEIPRISASSISTSPSTSSISSDSSVVISEKPPQTCPDQSHFSSDVHQSTISLENKDAPSICDIASNTNLVIDTIVCDKHDGPSEPRTSPGLPNDSENSDKDSTKAGTSGTNKGNCTEEAHSSEGTHNLEHPRIQRLRYTTDSVSSSFSSCHSNTYDAEWDRESDESCETSSYNSESNDDEEITLALQAAELASRKEARARFRSSSDLIHRLFVCISGVADQLQTNYAGDLRNILKCVFDMNCSDPVIVLDENPKKKFDRHPSFMSRRTNRYGHRSNSNRPREPPQWVPDDQMEKCMACEIPFNFVRRRHHCRNCGKIYCGQCSSNFVPLPHFGYMNPVRVCNHCFLFQVTPFTVNE
ncbi:lateral signaling target protein 2 homolog [Saccostrea cucullata]|uniref:lateral signaling target protein 2 homolog n=1 Tax=Saccostrea cuccullata TaxID=36930 RepID=UPI002ED21FDA